MDNFPVDGCFILHLIFFLDSHSIEMTAILLFWDNKKQCYSTKSKLQNDKNSNITVQTDILLVKNHVAVISIKCLISNQSIPQKWVRISWFPIRCKVGYPLKRRDISVIDKRWMRFQHPWSTRSIVTIHLLGPQSWYWLSMKEGDVSSGCRWFNSRSEQAPRSGLHPRTESDNSVCGFLGPP